MENIILIITTLILGVFFGAVLFDRVNKIIYGEYFYKKQKAFYIVGAMFGAVASGELLNIMFTL